MQCHGLPLSSAHVFVFICCVSLSLTAHHGCNGSRSITSSVSCPERCGSKVVPYPFGLHTCGLLPAFKLSCDQATSELQLRINGSSSPSFRVLSLTPRLVSIDPQPGSQCAVKNYPIFPFPNSDNDQTSYSIPGSPFSISRSNVVMMFHCRNESQCQCGIKSAFSDALRLEQPFHCPDFYCCGLLEFSSLQSLMKNNGACTSFISWAVHPVGSNISPLSHVQVQYGLELEAWVPGPCSCHPDAHCFNDSSAYGGIRHSCSCDQGFTGDGFANGIGCYRNDTNGTTTGTSCRHSSFVGCSRNIILLVTGVIAGTFVIVLLVVASVCLRRRNSAGGEIQSRNDLKHLLGLLSSHKITKLFTYKELEKATKRFSDKQVLGNGAFGTVYAGKLNDGSLVAVKRINYRYVQGIRQVVNEVKVLTAVRHPNLVHLLGCCLEYGGPLLVYEFVPNGTLSEHLQGRRGIPLSWARRVSIAEETARALAYLHSFDPPICHRDVKSSNILLDHAFTAKVADFGLSRLVLTDNSHISTVPQGTPGYLDPDYHQNFHLSDKSDVYSFGVVLVELITAMKPVDFSREKGEINLATLALTKIGNGTLDDIIDETLGAGSNSQIRTMIQVVAEIAFRCLSFDKNARPTMKEVSQELESMKNGLLNAKARRQSLGKMLRQQNWSSRRESSVKVRSVSSSSMEDAYESNDSFRSFT